MGLRPIPLAAACAALLASCGRDEPPLDNQQMAEAIENVAVAREEPKKKGPVPPALTEFRSEDAQRAPGAGVRCDFSRSGRLLFVSVGGAGIARVNRVPVDLAPSGPTGPTGGFWATERFSISIGRVVDDGAAAEEIGSWPARLVLTDRRQAENNVLRQEGTWRCGA